MRKDWWSAQVALNSSPSAAKKKREILLLTVEGYLQKNLIQKLDMKSR
jgi:hypothetical protein